MAASYFTINSSLAIISAFSCITTFLSISVPEFVILLVIIWREITPRSLVSILSRAFSNSGKLLSSSIAWSPVVLATRAFFAYTPITLGVPIFLLYTANSRESSPMTFFAFSITYLPILERTVSTILFSSSWENVPKQLTTKMILPTSEVIIFFSRNSFSNCENGEFALITKTAASIFGRIDSVTLVICSSSLSPGVSMISTFFLQNSVS